MFTVHASSLFTSATNVLCVYPGIFNRSVHSLCVWHHVRKRIGFFFILVIVIRTPEHTTKPLVYILLQCLCHHEIIVPTFSL